MVAELAGIAGRPWPAEIGGSVAPPRGLLVAGDLTDHGRPEEWDRFAELFSGPSLPFPMFETVGNHDVDGGPHVAARVRARHGDVRYSWDWGDLHLVSLGDGPDYPALRWLMEDLAAVGRERPVVLFLHYPLAGPLSEWNWFGDGDYREHLARILEGFNVVAIFHGHWHASGRYEWRGIPVYNAGSWKHGYCDFLVVRLTDERLTVASRLWYDRPRWWWWEVRPVGRGRDAELQGSDLRPDDPRRPRIPYLDQSRR
jgi:3',5'-cyclic AMP phosphodiesterase CpdA